MSTGIKSIIIRPAVIMAATLIFSGCALRGAPGGEVTPDSGSPTWSKTYGSESGEDRALAILPVEDGFVFTGSVVEPIKRSTGDTGSDGLPAYEFLPELQSGQKESDGWLQKVDVFGNVVWSRQYGQKESCLVSARDVVATRGGGYLTVGTVRLKDNSTDIGVMKIDASGQVVWCRAYNGTRDDATSPDTPIFDEGFSIDASSDGGYAVAGTTRATIRPEGAVVDDMDILVIRLDENGDVLWQKEYGNRGAETHWDENPYSIHRTENNGWVIAATARTNYGFHQPDQHFLVLRLRNTGELFWSWPRQENNAFPYDADDSDELDRATAYDATQLANGHIAVVGGRAHRGVCEITRHCTDSSVSLMLFTNDGDFIGDLRFSGRENIDYIREPLFFHEDYNTRSLKLLEMPQGLAVLTPAATSGYQITRLGTDYSVLWQKSFEGDIRDFILDEAGRLIVPRKNYLAGGEVLQVDSATGDAQTIDHLRIDVNAMTRGTDGSVVFVGTNTNPDIYLATGIAVIKKLGDENWFQKPRQQERFDRIERTSDGGFLLTGTQERLRSQETSFMTLKVGTDGGWCGDSNRAGCFYHEFPLLSGINGSWRESAGIASFETSDGYVLFARTGQSDTAIRKITKSGVRVFEREYDFPIAQAVKLESGGYLVVGANTITLNEPIHVMKLDGEGNIIWKNAYQVDNRRTFSTLAAAEISPDAYAIAGEILSGNGDVFVLMLDDAPGGATVRWQRVFGNGAAGQEAYDAPLGIAKGGGDTILVTGQTTERDFNGVAGGDNVWVFSLDAEANIRWQKLYATGGRDLAYAAAALSDGVIVAGETDRISGSADAWILRLNADGMVGGACPNGLEESTNAYTRPGSDMGTIPLASGDREAMEFDLITTRIPIKDFPVITAEQCSASGIRVERPSPGSPPESGKRESRGAARSDYVPPEQQPAGSYVPPTQGVTASTCPPQTSVFGGAPRASFVMNWDKAAGILELDASCSPSGYTFHWDFSWTSDDPTDTTEPKFIVNLTEEDLYVTAVGSSGSRTVRTDTVVLQLISSEGSAVASQLQRLPQ